MILKTGKEYPKDWSLTVYRQNIIPTSKSIAIAPKKALTL
jgi:hypothetical protein